MHPKVIDFTRACSIAILGDRGLRGGGVGFVQSVSYVIALTSPSVAPTNVGNVTKRQT